MSQSVLGSLTFGYRPFWNRPRALAGVQLFVHEDRQEDAALRALLADLDNTYGPGLKISGHNEYAAKACPGFNVGKWLAGAPPLVDADPATDLDYTAAAKLRWRLAEIRDTVDRALAGE